MTADTVARKRRALELLAVGQTIQYICSVLGLKRHKIRQWKQSDDKFRRDWNGVMHQLGRISVDMIEEASE